jgi:putative RecB family exonuclease
VAGVRFTAGEAWLFYSYSKLRSFEKCPLQFRYRYLERIPTTLESIEAFTGKRVHEVLEALYRALAVDPRPPALAEILALYTAAFERAWHEEIEVVKTDHTPLDYYRLGRRCLATFYRGNWPFAADRTLGLEEEIEFPLAGPDSPRLTGFIDRVAVEESGDLVIHDYKTSTYLPRKEEILGDLQLAIYELGARARWPERGTAKLVWHFLAFGRRVTVRLGTVGLAEKRTEIERRIVAIERAVGAAQLPARVSALCRWCAYRTICPAQSATLEGGNGKPAPIPLASFWPPPGDGAARTPEPGSPVEGATGATPHPGLALPPLKERNQRARTASPAGAESGQLGLL